MNINLIPAPWAPTPNSLKAIKQPKLEFKVADISSKWNGSTTTLAELKELGYTHAQIRYGKNNTKVWYGTV